MSFFRDSFLRLTTEPPDGPDVHLDGVIARYGRYGGFADVVQGATPYFYPMTYGLSRMELKALADMHARVRPEILEEAARFTAERFEAGAYVVGVHYRGTDMTGDWRGRLTHYRTERVPYRAYAGRSAPGARGGGAACLPGVRRH